MKEWRPAGGTLQNVTWTQRPAAAAQGSNQAPRPPGSNPKVLLVAAKGRGKEAVVGAGQVVAVASRLDLGWAIWRERLRETTRIGRARSGSD